MIDMKQAVQTAKEKAAEVLSESSSTLEEIERSVYNGREVWSITLGLPRELRGLLQLNAEPLRYKRFLIDAETGELLAVKLRELAAS